MYISHGKPLISLPAAILVVFLYISYLSIAASSKFAPVFSLAGIVPLPRPYGGLAEGTARVGVEMVVAKPDLNSACSPAPFKVGHLPTGPYTRQRSA